MTSANPLIFAYLDYRLFLSDLFKSRKLSLKKYSHRKFAADLGLPPSNFLHLVMQGKRNLSNDGIAKIAASLHWTASEKNYFKTLALFNQTEKISEKDKYRATLEKILNQKRTLLSRDQDIYFSRWYIPVLREIVMMKNFVSNLNWISRKIVPSIDEREILDGLKILEKLGLIKKEQGKWKQVEEHLTTEPEVTSNALYFYQKQLIELSLKSLELPAAKRNISSMTFGLSAHQFQWLKKRVIEFQDEIQQHLQEHPEETSDVALLNIQFFPATHS